MNTTITEENATNQAPVTNPKAAAPAKAKTKAKKEAALAQRRANSAPAKGKGGKKAKAAKKTPAAPTKGTGARDGSKTAKVLDLLKRPGGVSAKELMRVTGWQKHSVRGFSLGDRWQEDGACRGFHEGRG